MFKIKKSSLAYKGIELTVKSPLKNVEDFCEIDLKVKQVDLVNKEIWCSGGYRTITGIGFDTKRILQFYKFGKEKYTSKAEALRDAEIEIFTLWLLEKESGILV